MIPDSIPSNASQGEKTLYHLLSDRLPDDFIVWYEPRVKNLYPDFVVLGPGFGLLILEVKGWFAHHIERANHNFFDVRYRRDNTIKIETYPSPLKQGHNYFASVSDKLLGYPLLCHPDGNYQGRLAFPVGVGAVMSNITEAQARDENLYVLLEKPQVAYRDELLGWENISSLNLIARLKAMFTVDFPFPPLTPDQISTIKGVLHPETVIKQVPASQMSLPLEIEQPLPSNSMKLVSLAIEQERLARKLKGGHRLFSGVAGSGKTLILLARAKALANRLSRPRVLILCFNITLAAHLRSQLHSDEQNPQYRAQIQAQHFHDWARSLLGRLPVPREFNSSEEYETFLGQQVLLRLQQRSSDQKWDAVLVDEAHTFSPDWFLCCVAALKDPLEGDLMIVSDGSQSLYQRRKFTWKSVGIQAQGRSQRLAQNYRNTHEILSAAWQVVQPAPAVPDEDATFPIVEPRAALRHGPKPVLHLTSSRADAVRADAVEAVLEQVRSQCESGYAPAEMAILYRYKSKKDEPLFQSMLKRLNDMGVQSYWITESTTTKLNYSVRKPGVRVLTTLSSLGLEFKVVLLIWVEQFNDCCDLNSDAGALARRQLYVAMTRAQDELHLFGHVRSPLVRELRESNAFSAIAVRASQVMT